MKEVILYTDGACSFNPGPGGWGCVIITDGVMKEMSGGDKITTNNRMELQAVISGLDALTQKCKVDIYTDSAYVCNAFQQNWIDGWKKRGWVNSKDEPVANQDLWQQLLAVCEKHVISWHKVKGHADNELNNRCDELARVEVERILAENPNIMDEVAAWKAEREAEKVALEEAAAAAAGVVLGAPKTVEELVCLAQEAAARAQKAAEQAAEYVRQIARLLGKS